MIHVHFSGSLYMFGGPQELGGPGSLNRLNPR